MDPLKTIASMKRSTLRNYIIPGVNSSLIGGAGKGVVRLFESNRDHQEAITPHSHRFDFTCYVLQGHVRNRIWRKTQHVDLGDAYRESQLIYCGQPGNYRHEPGEVSLWGYSDYEYKAGDWYSMHANEVHSIYFSRGAVVLFFEGPCKTETSLYIEPVVGGQVILTLQTQPWMFLPEEHQ